MVTDECKGGVARMRVWLLVLVVMLTLVLGGLEVLASRSASIQTPPVGTAVVPWK
jgi:hypothetical protein